MSMIVTMLMAITAMQIHENDSNEKDQNDNLEDKRTSGYLHP